MIEIDIKHNILTSSGSRLLKVKQNIEEGAFVLVKGNSGIGKTTFFKIFAGLLEPDLGYIEAGGKLLMDTSKKVFVSPQMRDVAIMFQNYALFPNMTVKENITFSQKKRDLYFVDDIINKFDLELFKNSFPAKLSGGQQQRVALARALAQEAGIILLDEPLSAVDINMRKKLIETVKKYHQSNESTFFVISHNEEDFKEYSSHCVVIE